MNRAFGSTFLSFALILCPFGLTYSVDGQDQSSNKDDSFAENLILITIDGLRPEEVFGGADVRLMTKEAGGVRGIKALKSRFLRDKENERREALMPFFWNTIARKGQLIGDPSQGSEAKCTNGLYFSYPGYNELLSGRADPAIVSNAKKNNPNQTVLEWLNEKKEFNGRVAAFGSWDVFPFIINTDRSKIYVNAGWTPLDFGKASRLKELNEAADETPHVWPNVRFDLFTFEGAMEYLHAKKPRVLYVAFGETDDWAHDGRYDLYLDSAFRTDRYINRLWESIQKMPQYKGKTAMLITTDHGRGDGREGWKNHGITLPGSENVWFAVMGKGVPALGNRKSIKVTQSQFAASAAALLGKSFDAKGSAAAIQFKK